MLIRTGLADATHGVARTYPQGTEFEDVMPSTQVIVSHSTTSKKIQFMDSVTVPQSYSY